MSYPALSRKKAVDYVLGRRNGTVVAAQPEHELRGSQDDCYDDLVAETLKSVIDGWNESDPTNVAQADKDGVTGRLGVTLYKGFRELPGSILSDRDFWRYCAATIYDIIQWRMGENCSLTNYGA